MAKVRRVVIDVLKPHDPSIIDLSSRISDTEGVEGCDIVVYEVDREVENVKISIEGRDIDYEKVKKIIESAGCAIHSIDKATTGTVIVDEITVPQEEYVKLKIRS